MATAVAAAAAYRRQLGSASGNPRPRAATVQRSRSRSRSLRRSRRLSPRVEGPRPSASVARWLGDQVGTSSTRPTSGFASGSLPGDQARRDVRGIEDDRPLAPQLRTTLEPNLGRRVPRSARPVEVSKDDRSSAVRTTAARTRGRSAFAESKRKRPAHARAARTRPRARGSAAEPPACRAHAVQPWEALAQRGEDRGRLLGYREPRTAFSQPQRRLVDAAAAGQIADAPPGQRRHRPSITASPVEQPASTRCARRTHI